MDPEQEISAFLRSKGVQRAVINDMLNQFAHDLAEAIREVAEQELPDTSGGMKAAADLIDPEVE